MKIDHIAIAVNDVEESAKVYQEALGVDSIEYETVETEGVKVAIIHLENGRVELMQPTNDNSPIKKFLEKKGQGLHHMALDLALLELKLLSFIQSLFMVYLQSFAHILKNRKNNSIPSSLVYLKL